MLIPKKRNGIRIGFKRSGLLPNAGVIVIHGSEETEKAFIDALQGLKALLVLKGELEEAERIVAEYR